MPSGTEAGSRLTRLVLASASPRRQALLGLLGLPWRVAPVEIDEDAHLGGEPAVAALNVAMAKARAMRAAADDEVLLAADTLVVIDRDVLAKPADANQAWAMLRRLRDRAHQVLSGIALWRSDGMQWGGVVATRVVMRAYTDADIEAYIARGEPFDKAGGYAVQDQVFGPVETLDGCYLNVVGLPLCAVSAGLRAMGVATEAAAPPPCGFCQAGAALVSIRSGS